MVHRPLRRVELNGVDSEKVVRKMIGWHTSPNKAAKALATCTSQMAGRTGTSEVDLAQTKLLLEAERGDLLGNGTISE